MRKSLFIAGLVAAMLAVVTNDATAQRRSRGGSYSRGYSGYNNYYHSGYYHNGYYHNNNWYPYVALGVGALGYGLGYGGYGGYYYPSYSYGSGPYYYSDYYSTPTYYYPTPTYATDARPSYYSDPGSASVTVLVPNADAQIWFDETLTTQRGMQRIYYTPPMQQAGTYTVKARWTMNGRPVDQTRSVRVQPGQSVTVDFRTEPVPSPRPPQPE